MLAHKHLTEITTDLMKQKAFLEKHIQFVSWYFSVLSHNRYSYNVCIA